MYMLLGIGNTDRGDDGVGPFIAASFQHPDWLCLDAGTAPENFTGVIRRHRPERLILVDAADMGLPPGSVRRVPRSMIQDTGWSSHMLPLYHVIDFVRELVSGDITVIGIQPDTMDYDTPMSATAHEAARRVIEALKQDTVADIPALDERGNAAGGPAHA